MGTHQKPTSHTRRMGTTHAHMETRDRTVTVHVCPDCDTPWESEAALERCDCGTEDRWYSPSRNRLSYYPGDD